MHDRIKSWFYKLGRKFKQIKNKYQLSVILKKLQWNLEQFQILFLTIDIQLLWERKLKRAVIIRSHIKKLITFCYR